MASAARISARSSSRMAPVFEVGDGRYSWLRENLFVAEGRLTGAKAISYDIYRVL